MTRRAKRSKECEAVSEKVCTGPPPHTCQIRGYPHNCQVSATNNLSLADIKVHRYVSYKIPTLAPDHILSRCFNNFDFVFLGVYVLLPIEKFKNLPTQFGLFRSELPTDPFQYSLSRWPRELPVRTPFIRAKTRFP